MTDIIVVGGGPAGMTAAIYARRNGKTVLVLEKNGFGGQITYSPKVENYPGFAQISGTELADRMLEQMMGQGAEAEVETVTEIAPDGGMFRVRTEEGSNYEAKAVILATGARHRMLGLPGETDYVGNGISFCAVCDGDFYKGQTVAVAGGGNSALQEALLLSDVCRDVIVVQDLEALTGEQRSQDALRARKNVRIITGTVIDALQTAGGKVTGLHLREQKSGETSVLACDGMFVAIGLIPDNGPFADLVPLNPWGYADCGESCESGTPGVFAAGDCRAKTIRQLTTAVGDGAIAAVVACRYIDQKSELA
ncbi:MAG: FAD-dependent oxidoreductase [Oscillospiraceae bacterium]|nr:FAD-dependent oxidoreductase [Oscillospiraceae bacterium]